MIPINPVTVGIFAALVYFIVKGGAKLAKDGENGGDSPDRGSPNGTTANDTVDHGTGGVTAKKAKKGGAKSGVSDENKLHVVSDSPGNDHASESNGAGGGSQAESLATVKEVDEL